MRSALREQAELLAWGGDLANDRRRACGGRGLNGPTASTTRANAGVHPDHVRGGGVHAEMVVHVLARHERVGPHKDR
jgi:hypothetical protein